MSGKNDKIEATGRKEGMKMITFVKVAVIGDETSGFGISALLPDGGKKEYAALYTDRRDASRLCDKINGGCVSESHLFEIIEDELP